MAEKQFNIILDEEVIKKLKIEGIRQDLGVLKLTAKILTEWVEKNVAIEV